ncbi:MAG: hypothetical protein ACE5EN_02765 [Nitrospinota bacterium]
MLSNPTDHKNRFAALDLGSNTLRLLVAEPADSGFTRLHYSQKITRLGERLHETGSLGEQAMERTLVNIKSIIDSAAKLGPFKIAVTATHALRAAANAEELKKRFRKKLGFDLQVISQEREAAFTLKGAEMVLGDTSTILLFDIGGGSTEFIYRNGNKNVKSVGTDLGVVRLAETFIKTAPLESQEFCHLTDYLAKKIAGVAGRLEIKRPFTLAGTAGTITSIAAMRFNVSPYDPDKINNRAMSVDDIKALLDKVGGMTIDERSRIPAISQGREDLIIPGMGIILAVMHSFGVNQISVSDAGLLEGVMLSLLDGSVEGTVI